MLDFSFEPYRQEMIDVLSSFLKIESVKSAGQPIMPYGKGIFDALMFVQSTAERMDLECVNLFGHLAYVDYGYGDEMLGILTHIDVVPAGEGWTLPAFGGTVKDDRIFGRGAIDNKGPAIAALYALKALSDNCIHLNKKVRLIFGADEESGWDDMEFYKRHEPLPDIAFSPDGEYPVINAEKGLLHTELSLESDQQEAIKSFTAGTRVNVVPNKADCVLDLPVDLIERSVESYTCPIGAQISAKKLEDGRVRLTAIGKSAHGSRPEQGINAAASLIQYLGTLALPFGTLTQAIYTLSEKIGTYVNGELAELALEDERSGKLTLNLGTLSIKDGKMRVGIDIRYPVSYLRSQIEEKLEKHFGSFNIGYSHALDPHFVDRKSVV